MAHAGTDNSIKPKPEFTAGRLVAAWYAGLIAAGALAVGALANADSRALAAAMLAAAIVILIWLLTLTLSPRANSVSSHILVPAIGPLVIALLLVDYIQFDQRVSEAYATHLISPDTVEFVNAQWLPAAPGHPRHLRGLLWNHSPYRLRAFKAEFVVYAQGEEIAREVIKRDFTVPPGGRRSFDILTTSALREAGGFECRGASDDSLSAAASEPLRCVYRVIGTRGEIRF